MRYFLSAMLGALAALFIFCAAAVALAIGFMVVVSAFGVLVAFPLLAAAAERIDPRSTPVLHRVRVAVGRMLVNPGLLIVLIAGIYLAADYPGGNVFKQFYVQWGIGAVIVLGAMEGALIMRSSKQLAELGQRELDAVPAGAVAWSEEYLALKRRNDIVSAAAAVIVALTIIFMTFQS